MNFYWIAFILLYEICNVRGDGVLVLHEPVLAASEMIAINLSPFMKAFLCKKLKIKKINKFSELSTFFIAINDSCKVYIQSLKM